MSHLNRFFALIAFSVVCCHAQVVNVTPRVDCIQFGFGIASFGYININAETVTIPIGENNFFLQFPLNQGQPTVFQPGDNYHQFQTMFKPSYGLTWSLDNGYADATSGGPPICPAAFIDPQFAPMGLAFAQTLRVKATGISGTCNLNLGVTYASSTTVTLTPGQTGFLDVSAASLGVTEGQRLELVLTAAVASGSIQACEVSAEVYNSITGATAVAQKPQIPQYQPLFVSQGVASGETLRISATTPNASPCVGTFSFQDATGSPIGATQAVNVADGQVAFLDLPGYSIPGLKNGRAEIQPQFILPAPVPDPNTGAPTQVSVCLVSAEIFDSKTGATRSLTTPDPLP